MEDLFSGIYGQKSVKEIITRFLTNKKFPQALLFSGPQGVGKDFIAIRFANIINRIGEGDFNLAEEGNALKEPAVKFICPLPVGKNESSDDGPYDRMTPSDMELIQEEFRRKSENPYYKISIPKANDIKISSIRSLTKYLSLSFHDKGYRTVIISDAHLMNEPAQNSLLKNLEEPPDGFVFILTTSDPSLIRETIISRCWPVEFKPLSKSEIVDALEEYFKLEKVETSVLAHLSAGSISKALYLKEKNLFDRQSSVIAFLRYSLAGKPGLAQKEIKDIISENDAELFQLFVSLVLLWFEDFKRYLIGFREDLFYSQHIDTFEKFAQKYSSIDPNRTVGSIEKILYYMENNNLNMQIASYNIMFLIASLIQNDLIDEKIYLN